MAFEIRVNSKPFGLWESATVRRSIDSNAGVFRFRSSATTGLKEYPVKAGDHVQILVNGIPKVTGFVDQVEATQNIDGHTISISGRDSTQDIIDSSVPDGVKSISGAISLTALCERVINALGASIPVDDQTGGADIQFDNLNQFTSDSGRNAMQFLVDFARKKQVYLTPDGAGRLILFRPGGKKAETSLQHIGDPSDNVKRYRVQFNQQNRFNKYKIRSQDNFGFDDDADYETENGGTDRNGEVIDDEIRASRYFELQAEESMDQKTTSNRAEEEANIRRALSSVYQCEVQGVAQGNGDLWDLGLVVQVNDPFAGMRGQFLIKEVEYSVSLGGGTTTGIVCVPQDAYTVRGAATATDKRKTSLGERFQKTDGKTKEKFVR